MPLQITCPYCKMAQLIPDQPNGQAVACSNCKKPLKVATAPPVAKPVVPLPRPIKAAAPTAVPMAKPVSAASSAHRGGQRRQSSRVLYVVGGFTVVTMLGGLALGIYFWTRPTEPSGPLVPYQAKAPPTTTEKKSGKPTPKKIDLETEPGPDPEPPPPDLLARKMGEWYLDGKQPKVRLDFTSLEPTTEIKDLKVIVWTGEVAAPKASTWKSPPTRAGDSARQEFAVPFKDGRGSVEIALPGLANDKAYWLQPALVDSSGKSQWLAVEPWEPATPPLERRPAELVHRNASGERKAQLSSQATVSVPDGMGIPFLFNIDVHADLEETTLPSPPSQGGAKGGNAATLQVKLSRVRFEFSQEGIPRILDESFRRALDAAPKTKVTWRLDPTGTVSKPAFNFDDVPAAERKSLGEFQERLAQALDLVSLHLPNRELQPLEPWTHQRGWGKTTLDLTATYEGRRMNQGRDEAYLTLRGTVKGTGKHKAGKVEGTALVDLKGGLVMRADFKVEADIIVPFISTTLVQGPGVLEVKLTRDGVK